MLGPLTGRVLWEVLGSLGDGRNVENPGFSSFAPSWTQVSNFAVLYLHCVALH